MAERTLKPVPHVTEHWIILHSKYEQLICIDQDFDFDFDFHLQNDRWMGRNVKKIQLYTSENRALVHLQNLVQSKSKLNCNSRMIHHQIAILDTRVYYRLVPRALFPSADRICYQSVVHDNVLYSERFDVEHHHCTVSNTVIEDQIISLDEQSFYQIRCLAYLIVFLIGPCGRCTRSKAFLVQFILLTRWTMDVVDHCTMLCSWECLNACVWQLLHTIAAFDRTLCPLNLPPEPEKEIRF